MTTKDYTVFITNKDLEEGELKVESCIRADKIYTLSKQIVIKTFGRIKHNILEDIKDKINMLLEEKSD